MKLKSLVLLSTLSIIMTLGFTINPKDGDNILFILDASGSMKEKIGGVNKLDIAKGVLIPLLYKIPSDTKIGLLVYGHQGKKSGCNAIDLMVPVKVNNQEEIISKLISIRANGKTPIAASLEKGAEVLKSLKGNKTIILISDGEETCGGKPEKVAQRIRKKMGTEVAIHVIGFNVKGIGKDQLTSIAKAGGGKFYSAENSVQLKESLSKINKEVREQAIRKRKKLKSGGVIFKDDFDEDFLSGKWKILNEDMNNIILDEGFLNIVNQSGSLGRSAKTNKLTIKNVVLYNGRLPKNYEVVVGFNLEMVNWEPSKGPWSGFLFYKNPKNVLSLITLGYFDIYGAGTYYTQTEFIKIQGGERSPSVVKKISSQRKRPKGKQQFYFKVKKEKFKYSAFFSKNGKKWSVAGSFTFLGKGLIPGIAAWRSSNGNEVTTEFDYFKIRKLK